MADTTAGTRSSIMGLVLVPGLITLAVTILRLVGELQHWSPKLFNPAPGGPLSIVGIVWLPFVFGPYFAVKLASQGEGPSSTGKAIGFALLGLLVMVGGVVLSFKSNFKSAVLGYGGVIVIAAAAFVARAGWPALTKTLVAYGYAARIPVAIVMFLAMQGNWGTHYDAAPNLPSDTSLGMKYFLVGLLPQLVGWVVFTVIVGSIFGSVAVAITGRGKVAVPASS